MTISRSDLAEMLLSSARLLHEDIDRLSEIDSLFGDGDHGVTMNKIATCIENDVGSWCDESCHDFLEELGADIMAVNGGSAGPLFGTMIGGMAPAAEMGETIDGTTLKSMFASSLVALSDITTASVGDKSMMDALIPAVTAAQSAGDDVVDILKAAACAAEAGAQATVDMPSTIGRARFYGDKTIGTPDAGAVSTALFFKGLSLPLCQT